MKIKTKIIILAAIFISAFMALTGILYVNSKQIKEATLINEEANNIIKEMAELRALTFDYLLNNQERATQQWQVIYNSLEELLTNIKNKKYVPTEEELVLLNKIEKNYKDLEITFSQLVKPGISPALKIQLTSQQLIKNLEIFSQMSQLAAFTNQKIINSQTRANYLNLIFLIILLVSALSLIYLVFITILRPLTKLHKGIEIIRKGNLTHQLNIKNKDEIGQMAKSFNEMAAKLKELYTHLEEEVSIYSKVFTDSIDPIIIMDLKGNILKVNSSAVKLYGYPREEMIGKSIQTIIPPSQYKKGELKKDFETIQYTKSKEIIPVFSTSFVLANEKGEPFGAAIISKDITELKKAYIDITELKKAHEKINNFALLTKERLATTIPVLHAVARCDFSKSLDIPKKEDEFTELLVSLNLMIKDLEKIDEERKKIDKIKSEFVSVASHQLRTPLTAIKLCTELLIKGFKERRKNKKYLGYIYESAQRMTKIITDLLTVSRLETGRLNINPEQIDLIKLIKYIIKGFDITIKQKNCKIILSQPKEKIKKIETDPVLFEQVITNLISNAIKYSSKKNKENKILIKIEKVGANLTISVKDFGVGIPQKAQKRMFEKFYRGANVMTLATDGTGLGLYISKLIIEALGGEIYFESKENQGSTFYISLPLKSANIQKGEINLKNI